MASLVHENGGVLKLDREKLIRAREMLGYGLEKTADVAGVSKNSVLRAEHEEDIRPVTARKIAEALKVEVADLFPKAAVPSPSLSTPRQGGFLGYIKTLDHEALMNLSDELDERLRRGELSIPEYEDIQIKGLMVKMQMRVLANPNAKFEPVEVERKLTALAGAI